MWIARTVEELGRLRGAMTGSVALVPTMGALHAGHLSLIEGGRQLADHVIVSIYVNPTQFGVNEDFDHYPRPVDQDLEACENAGVAGVFQPSDQQMYPFRGGIECLVDVPALTETLEGEFRPGHFRGVCRVVAKLFNVVQPDIACFGRKDYQQLKVIEAMTADLAMRIGIVGMLTVREPDGLAMSSRNVYLDAEGRKRAIGLYKALNEARALVEDDGETDPRAVESAMGHVLAAHKVEVEYAAVRHPQSLAPLDCIDPPLTGGAAALVAGRVGKVRLIDNMLLGESVK